MKRLITIAFVALFFSNAIADGEEEPFSERVKNLADARVTDLTALSERQKLQAETAKLIADAQKSVSESSLNYAKRELILQEIARLQQRMRITEYEFNRIVRADYEMRRDQQRIEGKVNLVKSLFIGKADWKTWIGVEYLIQNCGEAEAVMLIMFDVKVPNLSADNFVPNAFGVPLLEFPGGNLGELYLFSQENNLSFRKYGEAHKFAMKILAYISTAAQLRIEELRQINQSIRLTIADIP